MGGQRALRADALRNRRRILDAAAEAFAEGGLEVGVAEIARRAGVGTGTMFRRFATKDDLILSIVEQRATTMLELAEAAALDGDAAAALERFVYEAGELHVRDRGFFDAVATRFHSEPRLRDLRDNLVDTSGEMLRRAQDAGAVRDDIDAEDLLRLIRAAVGAVGPTMNAAFPDLWRRYLAVIIDGLRPAAATAIEEPPASLAALDSYVTTEAAPQRTA